MAYLTLPFLAVMNVVSLITQLAKQDIRLWLEDGNLRYSAPDGAMTSDVIAQLRSAKPHIVAFLQQSEHSKATSLPQADRSLPLNISYAQQRLWFTHQLDPSNTAYHIHVALNLKGALNIEHLNRACTEIIHRHEILRTSYVQKNGQVQQIIHPAFGFTVSPEPISPEELSAAIHQELHQPFQLTEHIFRVKLWQINANEHALAFTIHHIAADGWSLGIFVHELVQLYDAYSQDIIPSLPVLERQYADYALWQQQNDGQHDKQLSYWKSQLENVHNLSLPYDSPPSTYINNEGSSALAKLNKTDTEKLAQLNKIHGTTLFMSLLAGLSVLLHKYSQQDDFCIGTPIAGRSMSQVEPLIGCFLNVLAIRCQPQSNISFGEYLQTIKTTCQKAFANQDVPFERIVQEVVHERDLAISPLFQVMLSLQNTPTTAISTVNGLLVTPYDDSEPSAQFDLKLTAHEHNGEIELMFDYKKALFSSTTMTRLAEHFALLMQNLIHQPEQNLHKVLLFSPEHKQELLGLQQGGRNATLQTWPKDESVITLFEQQVVATPNAIAVSSPEGQLTYAEFNSKVNQLTHFLQHEKNIGANAHVVICQAANINFLIAVYAIIKAGACYIPIDPNYPDDRIHHIINDAKAELVIADSEQQQRLHLDTQHSLCIAELEETLSTQQSSNPLTTITAESAIYCIYTSGSTGLPKGVEVKHQGESNLIHWYKQTFDFNSKDKCLIVSAVGFDLTQKNFFAPLCSGGKVVFHGLDYYDPAAILRLIAEKQISVINCAPSALYPLLQQSNNYQQLQSLRTVLLGGEPIRKEIVKPWLEATQYRCELVNMYGPTECTDIASIYRMRNTHDIDVNVIPIGRPIANTQLHILDNFQQLLPIGAVGELYIGGAGIAKGYVNNPELTAKSFIANPFISDKHPSPLLYKTGDLVRYQKDGNIEYVGRSDHQVKIRGLRIELGEIESRLQNIEGISESIVIARNKPEKADEQVLIAYYLSNEKAPSNASLRHQLLLELPQYMIPTYFITLDEWPLSANGKIDRKALPEPDWSQLNRRPYVAAETPTQIRLAAIWSDVLGVEKIGIHDNFFELGGHSLTATQALSQAQEAFSVEVPLRQIFENPNIEAIAELIDNAMIESAVFNQHNEADDDAESFIL
jgi:amino acid adenylation domain-containing protein